KVLAAVDWFQGRLLKDGENKPVPVRILGHGEGGRVAFYAAALDDRIGICSINGSFGPQENLWEQPIYRNAWGLLTEFGDAQLSAGFWLPRFESEPLYPMWYRRLQINDNPVPYVAGPPTPRPGRGGAAPGKIERTAAQTEFDRAMKLREKENWHPLFMGAE